jgi:hypothetical protein
VNSWCGLWHGLLRDPSQIFEIRNYRPKPLQEFLILSKPLRWRMGSSRVDHFTPHRYSLHPIQFAFFAHKINHAKSNPNLMQG